MEVLKTLLPALVALSLAGMVLAVGLDATIGDLLHLVRRPLKLAKAFLAISVAVPLAALLMVELLPLRAPEKAGILFMAVAPIPPLMPGNALKLGGPRSYVYGLYVAFALLAVVIVPVTVEMLSAAYGVDVSLSPIALGRKVLIGVIFPLAFGMVLRAWNPHLAARAAPVASRLSVLLLFAVLAMILGFAAPAVVAAAGNGAILAIVVTTLAGIVAGHLLGGPDARERPALAAAAATRNPGIALMMVGANGLDRSVSAAVLLYMLVSILAFAGYKAWLKRRGRRHAPA